MTYLITGRKITIMCDKRTVPLSQGHRLIIKYWWRLGLVLAGLLFLACFTVYTRAAAAEGEYVTSRAELVKALATGRETIYVGDIEFDESDLYVRVTRSVRIVGKEGGSVFKNGYFHIVGSDLVQEPITVSFENIIFDGCYRMPLGKPEDAASFDEYHGDRSGMGCISVEENVIFELTRCTVMNYCSKSAPALYFNYTDGNKGLGTRAEVVIRDCTFSGNTCERGVVWFNGKDTKLEMADCLFTGNNAYTGVLVLGGVKGTVENVTVKDNNRVVFKEKNSFKQAGGGIGISKSDLVLKNCVVDGNSALKGGGLMSSGSVLTLDSCKIINNRADTFGGGMLLESGEDAPIYVTNCLISGNSAGEEGAVWVWPADQIGIGLPTGIVEFSFCTFENNTSSDEEHLVFHPVMSENAETTVGRDGKIDFIACRIMDEKVTSALTDGVDYNVVNSKEKGKKVPEEVAKSVADGYWADTDGSFYAGMNERGSGNVSAGKIISWCLGIAAIFVAVLFIFAIIRVRYEEKKKEEEAATTGNVPDFEPADGDKGSKYEDISSMDGSRTPGDKTVTGPEKIVTETEDAVSGEKEKVESFIQKVTKDGLLTGRELDVLKEYLKGKTRTEISEALFISESTVKNHISSIFAKTSVKSKKELLALVEKA